MKKPEPKKVEVLEWNECIKYLEEEYHFKHSDYAGKFTNWEENADKEIPYQDFWHFIIDCQEVNNGGTIYFDNSCLIDCKEEWQKTIMEYILSEFGKGKNRECSFQTNW